MMNESSMLFAKIQINELQLGVFLLLNIVIMGSFDFACFPLASLIKYAAFPACAFGIVLFATAAPKVAAGSRQTEGKDNSLVPFVSGQVGDLLPEDLERYKQIGHIPFRHERISYKAALHRSRCFYALANQRRTVRFFSRDPVPQEIVIKCLQSAGTAPSGAHQQPWRFILVKSQEKKKRIRELVEREEQLNYDRRMKKSWVADVAPLVTPLHTTETVDGGQERHVVSKPYLTDAPYLVVVMKITAMFDEATGRKQEIYYPMQGVGIACGILICALNDANLVTLTSTPMGAEREIAELCERPQHEKVYLLLPVGYPADNATVPFRTDVTRRKPLDEIVVVL